MLDSFSIRLNDNQVNFLCSFDLNFLCFFLIYMMCNKIVAFFVMQDGPNGFPCLVGGQRGSVTRRWLMASMTFLVFVRVGHCKILMARVVDVVDGLLIKTNLYIFLSNYVFTCTQLYAWLEHSYVYCQNTSTYVIRIIICTLSIFLYIIVRINFIHCWYTILYIVKKNFDFCKH